MTWWIWVLAGLALFGLEALVPGGIIMVFFGVAALLVGVLVAVGMGGPLWFQWLLFSVVSVVSLLTLRGPILRRMNASAEGTETIDSLLGQQALAMEDLAPGAVGKAELRGTSWTAENVGDRTLTRGQHGIVERVEGLKLFVRAP
jgi:membrane protein implicated in regulation of membrane protease activity